MKKLASLVLALGIVAAPAVAGVSSVSADTAAPESYTASDWMPFNYVLTTGAGSSTQYEDIRTELDYSNDKLTATGTTTKGGMGVSFLPEVDITNFEMNVSLNSWQAVSSDRWFGMTLTDVLVKEDRFNEVPFYSKHSETWDNSYGAGVLFAVRPNSDGKMVIQFNYIGIAPTYNAEGGLASNAGEYQDNYMQFTGYIAQIQLCNEDWTDKTDYSDINISMKGLYEGDALKGIAFEINDGYWKRTDWNWGTPTDDPTKGLTQTESNLEENVFALLDKDANGYLSADEQNNFVYGSAWNNGAEKASILEYANYGDNFYSLVKFAENLKANNKRLYMSYMYKDAFNIRENSPAASFTINSVNGKAATASETTDLTADKTIEGTVSATLKETSLHAGVYPSMIQSLELVAADANSYKAAESAIKAIGSSYDVVNVKARTADGKDCSLISRTEITLDTTNYPNAKLYKITGSDVDEVDVTEENGKMTFTANSSDVNFVLYYDKANADNGGESSGCGSVVGGAMVLPMLAVAGVAVVAKKRRK